MNKNCVLSIKALGKTYPNGTVALRGADMDLEEGQFLAVLGPSGAGKSTLLRCISGLIRPSQGEMSVGPVRYDGSPKSLRSIRRITAMIFQEFNLFGKFTVIHNVLIGRLPELPWWRWLTRQFSSPDKEMAYQALERVGLASKVYERVNELSGGQRQRVGIARALVQEPLLLLADEPVASLDPKTSCDILELLREICAENGRTVICNLHQVEYGQTFSDHIGGLSDGQIVMDRRTSDVNTQEILDIYGEVERYKPEVIEPVCAVAGG